MSTTNRAVRRAAPRTVRTKSARTEQQPHLRFVPPPAGWTEVRTPGGYAYERDGARVTVIEQPLEGGMRELSVGVSHPYGRLLERDLVAALRDFGRGIPGPQWEAEVSKTIPNLLIIRTLLGAPN